MGGTGWRFLKESILKNLCLRPFVLVILNLLLSSSLSLAWEGKVVGVSDGDTITVMHEGKGERDQALRG